MNFDFFGYADFHKVAPQGKPGMARLLTQASRNNPDAIALGHIAQFLNEETLPEPFLPRFRRIQGHALQIRPDGTWSTARRGSETYGLDTQPTTRALLLQPGQRLCQYDLLAREVGAEWEFRKQTAGASQNEALLQGARRIVSVQIRYPMVKPQLARRLGFPLQAVLKSRIRDIQQGRDRVLVAQAAQIRHAVFRDHDIAQVPGNGRIPIVPQYVRGDLGTLCARAAHGKD